MIKLLVFDLDNTLAELGQGIEPEVVGGLKELEEQGVKLAVCSGKTVYYLCGLMRQVTVLDPVLIGENGGMIQFGREVPPKEYYRFPYADKARKKIRELRMELEEQFQEKIWFQPNEVMLTCFFYSEKGKEELRKLFRERIQAEDELEVYEFADCFDVVPKQVNKGKAVQYLIHRMGLGKEEVITIGDSANDYTMHREAGYSVGIGQKNKGYVTDVVRDIYEALKMIKQKINQ